MRRKFFTTLIVTVILCSSVFFGFLFVSNGTSQAMAQNGTYVYLGGTPLGIKAEGKSFVISKVVDIITADGTVSPARLAGLNTGDVIISLDDAQIKEYETLKNLLNNGNLSYKIAVKRGTEIITTTISPVLDLVSGERKLGLQMKKDIAGVGTLTYVRTDNFRYGALGHPLYEVGLTSKDFYESGELYECSIVGIKKGIEGEAGELRGTFLPQNPIGKLDKNLFCGVFGTFSSEIAKKRPQILLGNKSEVSIGNAYIYTTTEGKTPQKYAIEIVKTIEQNTPQEKSMVIRVTDEALLQKAGGIVQGMSGSPIVQNNKIIGAVTHVFLNDSTMGYGIYIDWMIGN